MKRLLKILLLLSAVFCISHVCAQEIPDSINDDEQQYLSTCYYYAGLLGYNIDSIINPDLYKAILRNPPYKRVDIGFTKQIVGDNVARPPHGKFYKKLESLALSLEIFNLLDVSNTVSYTWITDVTTARQYAVPNYLTGRQVNLKIQAKL